MPHVAESVCADVLETVKRHKWAEGFLGPVADLYPHIAEVRIVSYPILSYPILSYPILSIIESCGTHSKIRGNAHGELHADEAVCS